MVVGSPDGLENTIGRIVVLVLDAGGHLGDPAVLIVDRVAEQTQLGAEHMLAEGIPVADAEPGTGRTGVEPLTLVGQFESVVDAKRHADAVEGEIGQVDAGVVGGDAEAVAGAVAGDGRPRRDATTPGAFDGAHAAGRQKLAFVEHGAPAVCPGTNTIDAGNGRYPDRGNKP